MFYCLLRSSKISFFWPQLSAKLPFCIKSESRTAERFRKSANDESVTTLDNDQTSITGRVGNGKGSAIVAVKFLQGARKRNSPGKP